jgi:hypothetical protein
MSADIYPLPCMSSCSGSLLKRGTILHVVLHLTTGVVVATLVILRYKFTGNKSVQTKIVVESHVKYTTQKMCLQFGCIFLFVMRNYNLPSIACYLFVNSTGALTSLRR